MAFVGNPMLNRLGSPSVEQQQQQHVAQQQQQWQQQQVPPPQAQLQQQQHVPPPQAKGKAKKVAPFLTKAWTILHDEEAMPFIHWTSSAEGCDTFVVIDHRGVETSILPKYFKHNNMCSFVRQLNTYGFQKVSDAYSGGVSSTPSSPLSPVGNGGPVGGGVVKQEPVEALANSPATPTPPPPAGPRPLTNVALRELATAEPPSEDNKYTGHVFRQSEGFFRKGHPEELFYITRRRGQKRDPTQTKPETKQSYTDTKLSALMDAATISKPKFRDSYDNGDERGVSKVVKLETGSDSASASTLQLSQLTEHNVMLAAQVEFLRKQQEQQNLMMQDMLVKFQQSQLEQAELRRQLGLAAQPDRSAANTVMASVPAPEAAGIGGGQAIPGPRNSPSGTGRDRRKSGGAGTSGKKSRRERRHYKSSGNWSESSNGSLSSTSMSSAGHPFAPPPLSPPRDRAQATEDPAAGAGLNQWEEFGSSSGLGVPELDALLDGQQFVDSSPTGPESIDGPILHDLGHDPVAASPQQMGVYVGAPVDVYSSPAEPLSPLDVHGLAGGLPEELSD